jgi:hypothetical protein
MLEEEVVGGLLREQELSLRCAVRMLNLRVRAWLLQREALRRVRPLNIVTSGGSARSCTQA